MIIMIIIIFDWIKWLFVFPIVLMEANWKCTLVSTTLLFFMHIMRLVQIMFTIETLKETLVNKGDYKETFVY